MTELKYLTVFVLLAASGCTESPSASDSTIDGQSGAIATVDSRTPWGGLEVQSSGVPLANAKQIVVLLHGYGASSSDLSPLADDIGGDTRAFVFPAAPIPLDSGGLAWATTEAEIDSSLAHVTSLIAYASKTYPNAELSIGGFSQGATIVSMLLLDPSLPLHHMILYSPAFVLENLTSDFASQPRVLLSHGEQDTVLPFADSERLRRMLERSGYSVNWHPFDGGHTIPSELLDATRIQLDGR